MDFFCHELKLAIELDGKVHNYKFLSDISRQNILASIGVKVIRFNNEDVIFHLNDVLRSLELIISEIES